MMIKSKNFKRTIYEKFNLYIYIIVPIIVLVTYLILNICFKFSLTDVKTLNEKIIDISLTLAGILLTILGLFLALPNTKFRELMKKYKHDMIINNTLIIGILTLLATTFLSAIEKFPNVTSILFLIGFTETIIASIWIYNILKHINN